MRIASGRRSSGQTLPLFAIIAPGLLALMALGLDAAQVFLERRDAQGAADLAALAGVVHLPDDPVQARAAARANALANGYPNDRVTPITPYGGDADRIEVRIDSRVDTFFMPILGMFAPGDHSTVDVDARAVAEQETVQGTGGGGGFAIFALESCPSNEKTVDISGSDDNFIGKVHSNSDIHVSGSNNTFNGATTSVCGSPRFSNGGGGNTYTPAPVQGTHQSDPIAKTYAELCQTPTFTGGSPGGDWDLASDGNWWVGGKKDSKTLKPGVYCSPGKIKLGDQNIVIQDVVGLSGVTFAAQKIEISGSNFVLTPHLHNILFAAFASTDDAMKVSGSGGDWTGIIYAPNGVAELSGQNNGQDDFDLTGGVLAKRVKLNGSNANINGTLGEQPAGPPVQTIALIE